MFTITSAFSLSGNAAATLNSLTNTKASGATALSGLSTINYPVAGSREPNAANQLIFMAQPLSWWLDGLNSGAIKYTPVSNEVNWSFKNSAGVLIHIGMPITNLLIPNQTESSTKSADSMSSKITFVSKFGLSRVDTQTM